MSYSGAGGRAALRGAVDGLFVRIDPTDVVPALGDGVSPAIIMQLTEAAAEEIARQSAAARGAFEEACKQAGIALADGPGQGKAVSARWIELTGRRDELIPRRARLSDLTVLPRSHDQAPPELGAVLEATLFRAGRPLLVLPPWARPSPATPSRSPGTAAPKPHGRSVGRCRSSSVPARCTV